MDHPPSNTLFSSDLWLRALERYGSDTHLSVKLFDADQRVVFGPVHPTPLFQLFEEKGYDPGIFTECARRCLSQTDRRSAVMVSKVYGLTVVGTSLALEGEIVGAAVGGYAFADFSQLSEVQRLAKDAGIKFDRLWEVARAQKPVPQQRLMLNGELLQVLGDALLRENYHTRQYQDAVVKLREAAAAKERVYQELQQVAAALKESEARLATELAAAHQLQAASTLLIQGSDTQALYQKIVDAAAAIMQSEYASMQMFYPERGTGGELRLLAYRGFNPAAAVFWEWVRIASKSTCGAALRGGRRVIVADVETCDFMAGSEDLEHYRKTGIRAVQSTPLFSRDGRLLGIVSTHWRTPHSLSESELRLFDVLARQAADLLERNQAATATASLAAIVESSDDAIISKDLNGIVTSWNKGAERLFGYTAHEAIGQSVTILFPPRRFDEEPSILDHIRHGESVEHYETVRRRKDGKELDISLTVSPLRDLQGRIVGASKIARDITKRKQAEEALRQSVERLRFVMESMPQKIFTATPSGSIDYLNHQWTEFTGLAFEQIRDWGWTQFIHPDDLDENVRAWKHSIETGEPFQFEHRFRHKDGSYRWHFSRALAMRDSEGKIVMWIGSNTDVEDQRRSAEALRKAEKLAAAGRMAAMIAHEINNPLEAVTNLWYLLNQEALPPTTQERLKLLGAELNRVVHITKQTLEFYRVGSKASPVDLAESINDSIKLFAENAASRGAKIETDYRFSPTVNAYPGELRQVFSNLIINALEAGATAIKVRVSPALDLRHSRRGVRVIFADNGVGIPPEAKSNVFEPFVTTKADKGTGLGLWVTKGIIQKHEGWVRMHSSTNSGHTGTSFCIFLPEATKRPSTSSRDAGTAA